MEGLPLLGLAVVAVGVLGRELGPPGPRTGRGPSYAPPVRPPGQYVSGAELTRTRAGTPNTPDPEQAKNLIYLAGTLDAIREYVRRPMRVHSAFRSAATNAAVGGAPGSKHLDGSAADVSVIGLSAEDLAVEAVASGAPFDKLIWYPTTGHLHIQTDPARARRRTLIATSGGYVERQPVAV